jgi:hyperosmotically inducible periplasmic protein
MKYHLKSTLAVSAVVLLAQVAAVQSASTAPDNTKNNKMMSATSSADAQKNESTDLGLTKQIRQSVVADKSLSTDAHNVKIVAVDGTVTLNGGEKLH